jgi:hypothetical protein
MNHASDSPMSGTKYLYRTLSAAERHNHAYRGSYHGVLAQELGVKVLDEHFLDSCFGEAVLAVHGDELAAYAL